MKEMLINNYRGYDIYEIGDGNLYIALGEKIIFPKFCAECDYNICVRDDFGNTIFYPIDEGYEDDDDPKISFCGVGEPCYMSDFECIAEPLCGEEAIKFIDCEPLTEDYYSADDEEEYYSF